MRKIALSVVFAACSLSGSSKADVVLVPDGVTVTETVNHDTNQLGIVECKGRIEVIDSSTSLFGVEATAGSVLNEGMISIKAAGNSNSFTAAGIVHNGDSGSLSNSGTISIEALSDRTFQGELYGIFYDGAHGRLKNSGTISITSSNPNFGPEKIYGMYHEKDYGALSNCGVISLVSVSDSSGEGPFLSGMFYKGSYGNLINSGTISIAIKRNSTQPGFTGMESQAGYANLANCGTISVIAEDGSSNIEGEAIKIKDDYNLAINCGEISLVSKNISTSPVLKGMASFGSFNSMINCGSISLLDENSVLPQFNGVMFDSGNFGVITNCGRISVISSGTSFAINQTNNNGTLNLLSGSRIIGGVKLVNPTNTLNVGRNLNLALTFVEEFGSLPILGSIAGPHVGTGTSDDPLLVFDRTGLELQPDVVVDLSDAVLGAVSKGYAFCAPQRCGLWAEGIASYRSRSERVSYDNEQGGLLLGYSTGLCDGFGGIFGGFVSGKATVDGHTQEAELLTVLLGLSYEKAYDCIAFGFTVAGGQSSWENDRYVENNVASNGVEKAYSEPKGAFFTAQAHLSRYFPCVWAAPTLYGDLRYAGLFLGDYSEKGSVANFTVKERDVGVLSARIVLEPSLGNADSCFMLSPFVGLVGRHQLRGDDAKGAFNNGVELSFSQGNSKSAIAGLLGVRASGTTCALQWSISLEGTVDSESGSRLLAGLGAERSF